MTEKIIKSVNDYGKRNFCIGPYAGINLTNQENMLCLKFEGIKMFQKQLTPEQMDVIREVFIGEKLIIED